MAAKLARINGRIAEAGLELFLFDAWRPRAVQAYFHDVWMPAELKRRGSTLSGAALTEEVERYWAAPTDDPTSPAPHATAAAIDLHPCVGRMVRRLDGFAVRRCHRAGASGPV